MMKFCSFVLVSLLLLCGNCIAEPLPASNPAVSVLPPAQEIGLSPLEMFQHAGVVVKTVILILLLLSVLTWTIAILKTAQLYFQSRTLKYDLKQLKNHARFSEAKTLTTQSGSALSALLQDAQQEYALCPSVQNEHVEERIQFRQKELIIRLSQSLRQGMGILASVGATAPFIGLFGTVWGIMDSFIGISQSHSTQLAIVAPGIAEALLATGIGLAAAIPAVLFYNALTRLLDTYKQLLNATGGQLLLQINRELHSKS